MAYFSRAVLIAVLESACNARLSAPFKGRKMKAWKLLATALVFGRIADVHATVNVQKVTPFVEDDEIADAVKDECSLGEKLAGFVQERSKGEVVLVETLDVTTGRALELMIVDSAHAGNAFMGRNSTTRIRGTLYQDGQEVASFKARRNSMGGMYAMYKGNCSVLGRTVERLGKDVADWLADPKDGANLGD